MSVRRDDGFTLLELITQSREAVLKEDLFRFRDTIDQYYADKGKWPGSLDALVEEGYLRRVPNDPMTGEPNWEVVFSEVDPDNPSEVPGVYDVKSASTASSQGGTPYNEW